MTGGVQRKARRQGLGCDGFRRIDQPQVLGFSKRITPGSNVLAGPSGVRLDVYVCPISVRVIVIWKFMPLSLRSLDAASETLVHPYRLRDRACD
jgi:hypothetical protein